MKLLDYLGPVLVLAISIWFFWSKPLWFVLVVPLYCILFIWPLLQMSGLATPIDNALSQDIDAKFGSKMDELGIGYIRVWSNALAKLHDRIEVDVYTDYKGIKLNYPISTYSYDWLERRFHVIRTKEGLEVRYPFYLKRNYSKNLERVEKVVEFVLNKREEMKQSDPYLFKSSLEEFQKKSGHCGRNFE